MSLVALSELLGAPVRDASGTVRGRVREVAIAPQEHPTRIAFLIVNTTDGERMLPSASLKSCGPTVRAIDDPSHWEKYTASDGVNTSNEATVSITITSVNDGPEGADKTVVTNEDVAYTFTTADFGYVRLRDEGYSSEALGAWKQKVQDLGQSWTDAYVFFKHEEKGMGPKLAAEFQTLFG